MASIYPFRARRSSSFAVRLDNLLTQPVGNLSSAVQQPSSQRSPCNLVRILRGLPELFDAGKGESVYSGGARNFHAWRKSRVLTHAKVQHIPPCLGDCAPRFMPILSAIFHSHLLGGQAINALD